MSEESGAPAIQRRRDLAWVAKGERVAIVRLDDPAATPLVLTGGAVAIWLALEVPQSAASLVESVAASAGMAPEVIAGDVEAFVADAVGSGLLVAPESDPELSSPQPADS